VGERERADAKKASEMEHLSNLVPARVKKHSTSLPAAFYSSGFHLFELCLICFDSKLFKSFKLTAFCTEKRHSSII
jgi:hypothetical protein